MTFQYAKDYEFSEVQREDLWFYIRKMDIHFLDWLKKKYPRKTDGQP